VRLSSLNRIASGRMLGLFILKPVENLINTAIKTALSCLGRGGKVFYFKTQRHNFIEGARARREKLLQYFK